MNKIVPNTQLKASLKVSIECFNNSNFIDLIKSEIEKQLEQEVKKLKENRTILEEEKYKMYYM